jgi:predicted ATPase/DNA-binding winged helix-turn-helix (wHTH) protein
MESWGPDLVRVGTFELYPSERLLRSGGKPVELGSRAFDVLLVLVENHGRLVTKATLLERVWPRLVVDENNIPTQIASLRRALGVSAIRTVQGFGYRLDLKVSGPAANGEPPIAIPTAQISRFTMQRRAWPNRFGPLVGREDDLRNVEEALGRSSLVTIVGIAGVGKTRLAQELLARESEKPGGAVAWVSLAAIDGIDRVPSAIAVALGISLPDGLEEFAGLRQAFQNESLLLILDCAEHLSDALVTPLSGLILQTQGVRMLVTSQAPLGIAGELVYRLAALPVPQSGLSPVYAQEYPAVTFFAGRAAAADRRFELSSANTPLIAEICRRLDGIPLALELAAARVPALGLAALLERLDDRFRVLKGTGRPLDLRHGTLHAAFDWSYSLLAPDEQRVFNRLGTFAGSFTLATAAACVAGGAIDSSEAMDLIGRLVDRSLVAALTGDPPRYALLETARFYALERLAATGEIEAARGRMAATILRLLDVAYQEYWSLDEEIWLHRYELELDNVRAAMDWATRTDPEIAVALFGSAWPLLVETDLHTEARARYLQVLTLLSDALPRARIGRFWEAIATYDSARQCDRARYAAELAAAIHAATGDVRSHYYALMLLAGNWRVDSLRARSTFDAARQLEDPAWPARLLAFGALTEGSLRMGAGEFVEARSAYQRAVKLALTMSERQALVASVHIVELDIARGDTDSALQLGHPLALSLEHQGRRETLFELLTHLFCALLIAGEIQKARETGKQLYDLAVRLDASKLYTALDAMALLACEERNYAAAARILACSDAAHEAHGQAQRRSVEERIRTSVSSILDDRPTPPWPERGADRQERLDETTACALALGLWA